MTCLPRLLTALALLITPVAAPAAIGPFAGVCNSGAPSLLVRVTGLKNRSGLVRVRSFSGSPDTYFDKRHYERRIEVPVPVTGAVEICVPAHPGLYAVDVRHDANRNGDTDASDGIGASGNPTVSFLDVILRRRPAANKVQVRVGRGVTLVPVTVRYR